MIETEVESIGVAVEDDRRLLLDAIEETIEVLVAKARELEAGGRPGGGRPGGRLGEGVKR